MAFASKTYSKNPGSADKFTAAIKKRPVLYFGLPFVGIIVVGSFALAELTATKYNVHDSKSKAVSKEENLKLAKNRRRLDLQEEYWRLQAKDDEGWEVRRVDEFTASLPKAPVKEQ
ncbi:Cytochrome oxidase assembly [Actinomortierella ambigua]|nr:Cytochrome oxidase assembly [Actinomortierella ambigua]